MRPARLDPEEARRVLLARELERCRGWLEPALAHGGDATWDEVERDVQSGAAQLWPGKRSAAVTNVAELTSGPFINVWLAGGDLSEIVDGLQPDIERYARSAGCISARLNGRKGWERALAAHGFTPKSVILWKALA